MVVYKLKAYWINKVPDHFRTQWMCNESVEIVPYAVRLPLDHEMIKWYEDYKRRRAQKARIKEELMPIAWHPSRWWD